MGSYLEKPIVEKEQDDIDGNGLKFAACAMQGWRVTMEDSHIIHSGLVNAPQMSLIAVFDGHGGDLIAKEAAQRLVSLLESSDKFQEIVKSDASQADALGKVMTAVMLKLDEQMRQIPAIAAGEDQSGCTAIYALVTETHVICANTGDSRGIFYSGGTTIAMSEDHKPSNTEEQTRIEKAGGCVSMRRVNGDLAVSRALGDYSYKQRDDLKAEEQQVSAEPDIVIHNRTGADEFLLLCCDGIWDVMSNDEVGAFVSQSLKDGWKGMAVSDVCALLLDTCLDKGSRDNMSAVIALFPACTVGDSGTKPATGAMPE